MANFRHCSVAPFVYPSRQNKSCRPDRVMAMAIFRHCSVTPFVYPSRPIKSCRPDRVMSMAIFRHSETTLWIDMNPYCDYVYYLWAFFGIVRSPLLYGPLDQSNLVGGTVYCLWAFSGSFRHGPFLHGVTSPIFSPLSAPTCIVYGRFPALFGCPFV